MQITTSTFLLFYRTLLECFSKKHKKIDNSWMLALQNPYSM